MPALTLARQTLTRRAATAARWPVGIVLASSRYIWRTTAVHRWEMAGTRESDSPAELPGDVSPTGVQTPSDGVGPLLHRRYQTRIVGSPLTPSALIATLSADLDLMSPSEFASFQKTAGDKGELCVGDEYVVRMPGPWDGPVRVIGVTEISFRLATLDGHLEAGQIEFRASGTRGVLAFDIESWARSGDRLSDLLYTHLRMSKEVQLHMWTSVLERVVEIAEGSMAGGITVTTRKAELEPRRTRDLSSREARRLDALAGKGPNFDTDERPTRERGWHLDSMIEPLPSEKPGPPAEGASWQVARQLMTHYQLADPADVRALYRGDAPTQGLDMLLEIRFLALRFHVGVRVVDVYDEPRSVDGLDARVSGWSYETLDGHFEQGRISYEVWKWLDSGEVEFRLSAYSRPSGEGSPIRRLGFRIVGRYQQLKFYRQACRRIRRLTEAHLAITSDS